MPVSSRLADSLERYYRLLSSWNAKINLTGFKLDDPTSQAIDRLFIEPLAAAALIHPASVRLIDVGSGGGSPAIPMILALPGSRGTLVESKTRKGVFLREAIRALELEHVEVLTTRVEELLTRPELHETHDVVTVRAVRIEPSLLATVQAFLRPGGQVFLFGSVREEPPPFTVPLLEPASRHQLPGGSALAILRKRTPGVSRETSGKPLLD